jgi:hypothetical protein
MLQIMDANPKVGITGSKLIYPESGLLFWSEFTDQKNLVGTTVLKKVQAYGLQIILPLGYTYNNCPDSKKIFTNNIFF